MHGRRRVSIFVLMIVASLVAVLVSNTLIQSKVMATVALFQPVPTQKLGNYDYFGKSLNPQQAEELVRQQGLAPRDPTSYQRLGAVEITQELINTGENIFFNRGIGDIATGRVFGGFDLIGPEVGEAIRQLNGEQTTNLRIVLQKDLTLGGRTYPQGSVIDTGLDVERGASSPLGLTNGLSCALCHATLSPTGERLKGVPNGDLNIAFLLATAPNTASAFARLSLNPLDPQYQGNGKTIIDSHGQSVTLPDPDKFESAFDEAVLSVPAGNFESSPDGISNTTQIPSVFTFKSGPYSADGQFAVGPFSGVSAISNAVHSSEINILAAAQVSAETIGVDSEVYLGVALQNATDPRFRLPQGQQVKPSEWLRQVAPDPNQAELSFQVTAPGAGSYPNLQPSIFTYNGLIFSPNSNDQSDPASGYFLSAANAMAAFQHSLKSPPNRTKQNQQALQSGSVERGAKVFEQANCASCHIAPWFTDNKIHPLSEIKTNPARAKSRLAYNKLLVPPQLYTFNTPVPVPAGAEVLNVPTKGIAATPTTLPNGILPDGGYKTTSLLGLYLSAPYLHDGGVAVRKDALQIKRRGKFTVVDPSGLGLAGTLSIGKPADNANSLRALVDRQLRAQVVAANQASPSLVRDNRWKCQVIEVSPALLPPRLLPIVPGLHRRCQIL